MILAILLILFLLFVVAVWITVSLAGLIVTLVMAFIVGWLADKIAPGKLPYGWLGAIVAGLLGSWLGGIVFGDLGPTIGGISLIPGVIGAVVLAFALEAIGFANESTAR